MAVCRKLIDHAAPVTDVPQVRVLKAAPKARRNLALVQGLLDNAVPIIDVPQVRTLKRARSPSAPAVLLAPVSIVSAAGKRARVASRAWLESIESVGR